MHDGLYEEQFDLMLTSSQASGKSVNYTCFLKGHAEFSGLASFCCTIFTLVIILIAELSSSALLTSLSVSICTTYNSDLKYPIVGSTCKGIAVASR